MNWQRIAALVLLPMLLAGCWNAAYTGVQMVYDRNQLIDAWKNHAIGFQANQIFREERNYYPRTHISVASFQYDVLMVGQTSSEALRAQAEKSVRQIPGIRRLFNRVEVRPPLTAWQQADDAWMTTRIRSKLIANNLINPREIKVVTENHVVYLLGTVTPEHGKIVIDYARTTAGVRQVVSYFHYIFIKESGTPS